MINRIAPHTDKVYITTLIIDYDSNAYGSFNGNIVFEVVDGDVTITCSGSDLVLKDTEWFKDYRTMPPAWVPS